MHKSKPVVRVNPQLKRKTHLTQHKKLLNKIEYDTQMVRVLALTICKINEQTHLEEQKIGT